AYGAVSIALHTEMLIVAKKTGLDPAGILDALPLLSPGIGSAPVALHAQVLNGHYEADISNKRLQDDIGRVLDAARAAATPAMFLPLFAAAALSAAHSPHATGGGLDVARWMAGNAGVAFGAKPIS
ncbi:MAG: hypothetical protein WB760_24990, partial [Xanthobacteraceae bacterium]